MKKKMIPCIYLQDNKAVTGFGQRNLFGDGEVLPLASFYGENGADALLVFDFSTDDQSHEKAIAMIKNICLYAGIPVYAAGNIKRLEDVKKLLYAGCEKVVLNLSRSENEKLLREASGRFGKDRIWVSTLSAPDVLLASEVIREKAEGILCLDDDETLLSTVSSLQETSGLSVILLTDEQESYRLISLLTMQNLSGLSGSFISQKETDITAFKKRCQEQGLSVCLYESDIRWEDLKLNSDGMIPVVVQDNRTDQVLMVAYMNQEAFETTLRTGRMTYYSRSRQTLWKKGETSGHVQHVRSLTLDCDNDTILARVSQVGPACHTGSYSCFFKNILEKPSRDANPLRVFQHVYDVIVDRKENPREGSYTNYLFDKGIDKILKKVGEECTEIVIAAKNPDAEEIKYEIADFLYHAMVLMVEKGVTWEDITDELARRE